MLVTHDVMTQKTIVWILWCCSYIPLWIWMCCHTLKNCKSEKKLGLCCVQL